MRMPALNLAHCTLAFYGLAVAWALFCIIWPESDFTICLFKTLTGLPCPTCGTSRALVHLAHGHPADAASQTALIFPLLALAPWPFLAAIADVIKGGHRTRQMFRWVDALARQHHLWFVALGAAVLGYWVTKLLTPLL